MLVGPFYEIVHGRYKRPSWHDCGVETALMHHSRHLDGDMIVR